MLYSDNYLDEPENTEFKTAIISIIKGSKQFKENMNKNLSQLKEGGTQLPSEVQANSSRRLPDTILSAPYSSSRPSQQSA